jgi:hypothetical protein
VNTALALLVSPVQKVLYFADLRQEDGLLSHWGLERAFGQERTQGVLDQERTLAVREMLRVSLREIEILTEKHRQERADIWSVLAQELQNLSGLSSLEGEHARYLGSVLLQVSTASRSTHQAA